MPSLSELLEDLRSDEDLPDLGDLTSFAESLLQEALNFSAEETNAATESKSDPEPVVGTAPEIVESSRQSSSSNIIGSINVGVQPAVETTTLAIPQPARRRLQTRQPRQNQKKIARREEPKSVLLKSDPQPDLCFLTGTTTCITLPRDSPKPDIIANALSNAFAPDDCITIIVPTQVESGDCVILSEAVQEVTTSSYLKPQFKDEPLSPQSDITEAMKSESGYESFGSPHSDISSSDAMSDLWNESFSELFPNLH